MTDVEARNERLVLSGIGLRALRESKGVSLSELARRLDWDKGRLSKYEKGQLGIRSEPVTQIAEKLGLSPAAVAVYLLKSEFPQLADVDTKSGKLVKRLLSSLGP